MALKLSQGHTQCQEREKMIGLLAQSLPIGGHGLFQSPVLGVVFAEQKVISCGRGLQRIGPRPRFSIGLFLAHRFLGVGDPEVHGRDGQADRLDLLEGLDARR